MRELNIDWPALHSAFQMNMPEVRCFLSTEDGKVVKVPPGDPRLGEVRGRPDLYLAVEAVPSRIQYQWLDDFIKQVEDDAVRARMEAAINGKGAFRRFKDILLTLPDERRKWFEFRDVKMRERIVEWVAEHGIRAANPPPWQNGQAMPADTPPGNGVAAPRPSAPADNDPHDVEALRDFLIEWSEGKDADALSPLSLDALAQQIGRRFKLKPRA